MARVTRSKTMLFALVLVGAVSGIARDLPFSKAHLEHWAYKPVHKPAVSTVRNRAWVRTPIDAFILAKLEEKGLSPSPRADKITLLRRAAFDLTGLPPTPEEVTTFVNDRSTRAWERVVDRLLASPHYGERWARHWLDLARYAESDGFKADDTRPNAWRYRDYVIRAFNSDKPYDRFIQEQIAGDELWPDNPDALVATGFNRNYPDEYNARNLMQRRQEILNDITDTVGSVFLGTTYACARCHDHKYDPVLQKDYYRLQAFFAATRAKDDYPLAGKAEQAAYLVQRAEWENKTRDLRARIEKLEAPARRALYDDAFEKFPDDIQRAITTEPARRDTMQWLMFHKAQWQLHYGVDEDGNGIAGRLKGDNRKQWESLRAELAQFDSIKPRPLPYGSGITDVGATAPKQYVLKGGGYDNYGAEVAPGFLTIINPVDAKVIPCDRAVSTGRRSALAAWLTAPANPLVARVMVNRLWHYHFGKGIVGTPNDFGMMREKETHPELLDWLAATFVEQGWSIKKMHRMILLSNTYQQIAGTSREGEQIDPENKLLWRFRRERLSGEEIRDAVLSVSGKLNPKMYGPSVFPLIPMEMEVRGGWNRKESEESRNRRSVYVFVRRNSRYPLFQAFDMPDTHESCGRRSVTTTAPQSLNLLNDQVMIDAATALAERIIRTSGPDIDARIGVAYRLAYARTPKPEELAAAREFLKSQADLLATRITSGARVPLDDMKSDLTTRASSGALVDFCHALLISNEFIYVN